MVRLRSRVRSPKTARKIWRLVGSLFEQITTELTARTEAAVARGAEDSFLTALRAHIERALGVTLPPLS